MKDHSTHTLLLLLLKICSSPAALLSRLCTVILRATSSGSICFLVFFAIMASSLWTQQGVFWFSIRPKASSSEYLDYLRFTMDEGPLDRYKCLEIDYDREKGNTHITQTAYIETMAGRVGMNKDQIPHSRLQHRLKTMSHSTADLKG